MRFSELESDAYPTLAGEREREDAAANKHDCDGYLSNETTMNTTVQTRN